MIWTELHWVEGPWPGKLALAARPRGGEWLGDEIRNWHNAGVNTVFSLLTAEEEEDLDIAAEAAQAKAQGMKLAPQSRSGRMEPLTPFPILLTGKHFHQH
jgi:hypothetical protein